MAKMIVERAFPEALSDEEFDPLAQRLYPCLEAHQATWKWSYLSEDSKRLICEFEAVDAEAVRSSFRSAELVFQSVWPATLFASNE